MSEHVFYSTDNAYNHRELTIVNAALLVSKPPTKEKRIRIKVRMILSGQAVTGAPEWLSAAHTFVAQYHDQVSPNVEFKGYDLHFSAENLFDKEGAKSPRCQMRSFEIHECGESEAPDVAATFTIYAPFSTALWAWLGQYGGDSCWCSFTPGVPDVQPTEPDDEQPVLTSDDDDDAEEPEDDDEEEEEIDAETEAVAVTGEATISDVVLEDALHVFESHGKVSAVELQRVLSISYSKAADIIAEMQSRGMVTEPDENHVRSLTASGNSIRKSGPKELAAYHEKTLDAEPAKKRGRPRKVTPVDPLTVDAPIPF